MPGNYQLTLTKVLAGLKTKMFENTDLYTMHWQMRNLDTISCYFCMFSFICTTDQHLPYLDLGGGQNAPLRVFAEYLKNGLTDLQQTL